MKNRIFVALLAVLLCACVAGCALSAPETTEPPIAELSATVVENTLSSTGITVRLQNDETDYFFEFSDVCTVEKYAWGKWSEPSLKSDSFYSDAMAYGVRPGDSTEHTFSWQQRYGKLAKGKYRLVVHMTIRENDGSELGKNVGDYTLYVPFEL